MLGCSLKPGASCQYFNPFAFSVSLLQNSAQEPTPYPQPHYSKNSLRLKKKKKKNKGGCGSLGEPLSSLFQRQFALKKPLSRLPPVVTSSTFAWGYVPFNLGSPSAFLGQHAWMLLTDNILLGFPISSQFCLKTDVVSCILEPLKPFLGWFCFHVDLPRKEAAGYLSLKYQVSTSLVIKQSTLCSSNSNSPVWIILFKPVGEL